MKFFIKIVSVALIICPVFVFKILAHDPQFFKKFFRDTTEINNIKIKVPKNVIKGGNSAIEEALPTFRKSLPNEIVAGAIYNRQYSDQRILKLLADSFMNSNRERPSNIELLISKSPLFNKSPSISPALDGIAILPNNNESFSATFGKVPAPENLEEIKIVSDVLSTDILKELQNIPRNLEQFQQRLNRSKSDFFIVVGHNKRGELIIPPPPPPQARLEIKQLAESCSANNKICIMLSCQSSLHVPSNSSGTVTVRRDITFLEAAQIANEIRHLIIVAGQNGYKENDIIRAMPILVRSLEIDHMIALGIQITLLPAIIVGGGGIAIVLSSRHED